VVPGDAVELPEAPFLHLFVARGAVSLEGAGALSAGDSVRFTAAGGQRLTAEADAEVLVWEMHATVSGW
jgi:quercetin 2,3-dioxygenase